jgi:hypothetical protein
VPASLELFALMECLSDRKEEFGDRANYLGEISWHTVEPALPDGGGDVFKLPVLHRRASM